MTIQFLAFKGNINKTSGGLQHSGSILNSRFQNNTDSVSFSGKEDKKSKLRSWAAALALPLAIGTPNALANRPGDVIAPEIHHESAEGFSKVHFNNFSDVSTGLQCVREYLEGGGNLEITSNPKYYGKFVLNNSNQMIFLVRQNQTGDKAAFLVNEYQGELVDPMKYLRDGSLENFNYYLNDALGRFDNKYHCEDGQVIHNDNY